jgi:hypothetical protein
MNEMIAKSSSLESVFDDEFEELLLLYSLSTRKKLWKSDFFEKKLIFFFIQSTMKYKTL